ncbi:MAG TPA: hypothetical protein VN285_09945, partial [Candidatus Deferrimicrobium sp.]|nr:hypothetical protein [Candidatus Deferrimicrobium sp.]
RLKQQVARLNPRFRVVVFSALTRTGDLTHLVPKLQVLAPTHLIVTMLDQTPRWGSAITAATSLNTPIVFTTDSPSATSPLKSPDPDAFVRHLLGLEVCLE